MKPLQLKSTASDNVAMRLEEIVATMKNVQRGIDHITEQPQLDWGHVGSLSRVLNLLEDVSSFLNGSSTE